MDRMTEWIIANQIGLGSRTTTTHIEKKGGNFFFFFFFYVLLCVSILVPVEWTFFFFFFFFPLLDRFLRVVDPVKFLPLTVYKKKERRTLGLINGLCFVCVGGWVD